MHARACDLGQTHAPIAGECAGEREGLHQTPPPPRPPHTHTPVNGVDPPPVENDIGVDPAALNASSATDACSAV
jgi:hypothetical protein